MNSHLAPRRSLRDALDEHLPIPAGQLAVLAYLAVLTVALFVAAAVA